MFSLSKDTEICYLDRCGLFRQCWTGPLSPDLPLHMVCICTRPVRLY